MLIMNGLPRWHHPIFNWDRFSRVTNDGFFLVIEARDPRFSEIETHDCFSRNAAGCTSPSMHEENRICCAAFFSSSFSPGIVIVAMCGFRGEHGQRSPSEIFPDMVRQPKVRAQAPLDFFADGRGPRVPIARNGPDWLRNAKNADDGAAWDNAERRSRW